jgi:hypothetical protein
VGFDCGCGVGHVLMARVEKPCSWAWVDRLSFTWIDVHRITALEISKACAGISGRGHCRTTGWLDGGHFARCLAGWCGGNGWRLLPCVLA